ncbi:MAG TPA: DUF2569 domain-containing protein [Verrucomicrobiae bacterium]|nr:DUF2569 domain-containing protein [Verrucomicrobiae bacterium]
MFETQKDSNKIGLGGWLLVWFILNLLALIRLVFHINIHMLSSEDSTALTSQQSPFYHPLWRPLLGYEFFCQFFNPITIAFLIFLYARKSHFFPKAAIIIYLLNFIMVLMDAAGAIIIGKSVNLEIEIPWKEIGRCLIAILIWVPYFLKSERVKATFVKK